MCMCECVHLSVAMYRGSHAHLHFLLPWPKCCAIAPAGKCSKWERPVGLWQRLLPIVLWGHIGLHTDHKRAILVSSFPFHFDQFAFHEASSLSALNKQHLWLIQIRNSEICAFLVRSARGTLQICLSFTCYLRQCQNILSSKSPWSPVRWRGSADRLAVR